MAKHKIRFAQNPELELSAETGERLSVVLRRAGIEQNLDCNGRGSCGKCLLELDDGRGRRKLLSCQSEVRSDLCILNPDLLHNQSAQILAEQARHSFFGTSPLIKAQPYKMNEFEQALERGLLNGLEAADLRRISAFLAAEAPEIELITADGQPIDVCLPEQPLYGAAIDIGTTTVVLYALDFRRSKVLGVYSAVNGQRQFGSDVISRIAYALQGEAERRDLQQAILDVLCQLLRQADQETASYLEHLQALVLCGNTAMQHLLFGFNPQKLGMEPFVGLTYGLLNERATACSFPVGPACRLYFLPILGGFVGADTIAALCALPPDSPEVALLIDLGTNGELAIGKGTDFVVASTACGPALEGGNIACGSRAVAGAIERVRIAENGLLIETIGQKPARSICGSGLIDAVAALLDLGVMDETGRMQTIDELRLANAPGWVLTAMREDQSGLRFCLSETNGEEVYLSQKDIRQFQLAKAAICAGCLALLHRYGLELQELKQIYIAGAFGHYIDKVKACRVGLLPPFDPERIKSIGNAAGQGVELFSMYKERREYCLRLAACSRHEELAQDPYFMQAYIEEMYFPDSSGGPSSLI